MTAEEKIIDKIKKLLALASSSNVGEAAAAAAAAQALVDKHNLDLAALAEEAREGQATPEEPIQHCKDHVLFASSRKLATWKWSLTWTIAEHNHCKPWSDSRWTSCDGWQRTFYLIGTATDTRAAVYLFHYLAREIDRLCTIEGKGKGKTWANNFRLGAVAEVGRRLAVDRKALVESMRDEARVADVATGTSTALVRLNTALARVEQKQRKVADWMAYQELEYGGKKSVGARVDYDGFTAGRRAGAALNLGASTGAKALRK